MTILDVSVLTGLRLALVTTVGVCVAVGILAWRERPEPGAAPLTLLMAGACYWATALFFRLGATGLAEKALWFDLGWLGIAVIPVAWVLFSLDYTGQSRFITPKSVLALSVVPVLSAVVGTTNRYHDLMYVNEVLVQYGDMLVLERTPGVWFWVIAVYTLVLGVVGIVPLISFVSSELQTFRGQSLAILIGALSPFLTNLVYLLEVVPTNGIDPTPISFSISGIAFLGALTRFQLLSQSPAPIQPAYETIFGRMQEGAVVLDRGDTIIEVNAEAADLFEESPSAVLGRSVSEVLPEIEPLIEEGSGMEQLTFDHGRSTYEASVERITDVHDRVVGRVVTFHDITGLVRQQQRLKVLNRVLRHNVRTSTQVIVGNVGYLADHNSQSKAETVKREAMEIEAVSNEIRSVIEMFEEGRSQPRPVQLAPILEECLAMVRTDYPEVGVEADVDVGDCYVDSVVQRVLGNLIENAALHNTDPEPRVWVEAERDGAVVTLTIADNGPGIDAEELALIEEGSETPLRHGSGFGLAIAKWGTEFADGEISVEHRDPSGVRVSLQFPVLEEHRGNGAVEQRASPAPAGEDVAAIADGAGE